MKRGPVVCAVVVSWTAAGCASMGMNSVQKLNQLEPGMSTEQVQAVLGEPKSTEMKGDKLVVKYTLHENWKGFVPYYMVFNKDTRVLETWYEDEAEYQRNQAQMAQMMQPLLEASGGGGAAAAAGPNDPDLQRWITGNYYSFTSSAVVTSGTERSLTLCVDGRFRMAGEFGASGAGWGAASQSGGGGRWGISGDRQAGTISLSFDGGSTRNVRYQVDSPAEQTMLFDGVKFAYAGVANCN